MQETIDINLRGNVEAKAIADARGIDTLIAALKEEEKALKSTQVALTRMNAGSKVDLGIVAKAREGEQRIGQLKRQIEAARTSGEVKTRVGVIDAIEKSGGPIGGFIKNVKAAWAALRENPSAAAAVGLFALSAAAVALSSKLYSLAKDVISLGVSFADAGRSAKLLNEAADIAGGTHKQLGGIIEDVRRRSDAGRGWIAEQARELRMLRLDSRQTQLTLSAMALAETALGSAASGGVRSLAEQSRAMRRFALGARDAYGEYDSLRKIGLTKADFFGELARASGKNIDSVRNAAALGQISVTKGMAAIEAAMRRKFGGTVQAQSLSITSQFRRMREDFESLFTGSDMEPMLKGLRSITEIFSQDTASGRAFKEIVTRLLTDVGDAATKLAPDIKEALLSLSAGAAKEGGLAQVIRGWIADAKELGSAIKDIAEGIKTIAGVASSAKDALTWKAPAPELDKKNALLRQDAMLREQGKKDGEALTLGIKAGVEAGFPGAVGSITALAASMRAAFKAANEIRSPARVYKRDAEEIPAGAAVGVKAGTPVAVEAVVDMSARMRGGFDVGNVSLPAPGPAPVMVNIERLIIERADSAGEVISQLMAMLNRGPVPLPVRG